MNPNEPQPAFEVPPDLAGQPNHDPNLLTLEPPPRLGLGEGAAAGEPSWDLDMELVRFGEDKVFTIRSGCAGLGVFGETGSGKTSLMKTFALHYLHHRFGMLVLCVKPEEGAAWVEYAETVGRSKDVIRITADPDCKYRFDFLAHEMTQKGSGTLATGMMIQAVTEVLRRNGGGKASNDEFWSANAQKLIKNAIDLYKLAVHGGRALVDQGHLPPDEWLPPYRPTILTILELITSAVTNAADFENSGAVASSLNLKCLRLARKVAEFHSKSDCQTSANIVTIFNLTYSFWRNEWAKDGVGDSRLRDNIIAFAQSTMETLERGEVANLFQRLKQVNPHTGKAEWVDTVTPEMLDEGKIILVDVPVLEWMQAGQLAGCIWKYVVQRFLERRSDRTRERMEAVTAEHHRRVAEAMRILREAEPVSALERLLPEWLLFGKAEARRKARLSAIDELAYQKAKHAFNLKRVENSVRPVCGWMDECHNFITKRDVEYQATARSGRGCWVYMTQNISIMDDLTGKETRESLFSNVATKIFCRNTHSATNQWASEIIGSDFRTVDTVGENYKNPWDFIPSRSHSRKKENLPLVPPIEFTFLKAGGPLNDCTVEAIMVGAGTFAPRTTWLRLKFDQNVGSAQVDIPEDVMSRAKARVKLEQD